VPAKKIGVEFTVNGKTESVETYPMARLLDILRESLGLTGSKEGCGEGECGACSVILDGKLVNSCLIPIIQVRGTEVQTIESLAEDSKLHPVQESFLRWGGAQCGICTPGMVMAAVSLLREDKSPSIEKVREYLAGNLCRCTGYTKIFESVIKAAKELK